MAVGVVQQPLCWSPRPPPASPQAETAKKKEEEAAEEAEAAAKAAAEAARPKRSILQMLEVELPAIEAKGIEEFVEESFNLNRKGIFGGKTTVTKVLSWKQDVIKTALLKMPSKDLEAQATQAFRNITGFMGDRGTVKEDVGHAVSGGARAGVDPSTPVLTGPLLLLPAGEAAEDVPPRAGGAEGRDLLPDHQADDEQPQPVRGGKGEGRDGVRLPTPLHPSSSPVSPR